jgi:hypothetical protein
LTRADRAKGSEFFWIKGADHPFEGLGAGASVLEGSLPFARLGRRPVHIEVNEFKGSIPSRRGYPPGVMIRQTAAEVAGAAVIPSTVAEPEDVEAGHAPLFQYRRRPCQG